MSWRHQLNSDSMKLLRAGKPAKLWLRVTGEWELTAVYPLPPGWDNGPFPYQVVAICGRPQRLRLVEVNTYKGVGGRVQVFSVGRGPSGQRLSPNRVVGVVSVPWAPYPPVQTPKAVAPALLSEVPSPG